jgi:hypothetical protein
MIGCRATPIVIDWTVIRDEATVKDFSAQIIAPSRTHATRRLLRVTINGLVILSEQTVSNPFHTNPPGSLDAYYRNNVIGGPGAVVIVAENLSSFAQTILNKLIAEITSKPTR